MENQISIDIAYYAELRDQAGLDYETVRTAARTPAELYEQLRARHGFTAPAGRLRVAINETFAGWDAALRDRDAVVFIPPVSGG